MSGEIAGGGFVGYGIDFPVTVGPHGRIQTVTGEQNIERSMRLIIGTAYGERPMRPEFGCGIHDLVFETATASIASHARIHVQDSLRRWEPRVDVLAVHVDHSERENALMINVTYQMKDSYSPRNLLVPFYMIPSEES